MNRVSILLSLYLSFCSCILHGQGTYIYNPNIGKTTCVARVTGMPLPDEEFSSPNLTVQQWNIGGTDLGIVWEQNPGQYGIFFGDSYGRNFKPFGPKPNDASGEWRCNFLAFSTDIDLEDGLSFSGVATDNKGEAREIIPGGKDKSGKGDWTSIPTAAIRANGKDYVHYFNMRNWRHWDTNYSGLYRSADSGITWEPCLDVKFSSNSYFGQIGYFKKDGYIYMIGTETGRNTPARLARFREKDIERQKRYEYWDGIAKKWIRDDEKRATVIIDDKVGELSFIYNYKYKKWIIAYFASARYDITLRMADDITGPWSEPYKLVDSKEYPQLYGSFFHPLSSYGDELYFLMSMWKPYNVFLMKAKLLKN